MRLYEESGVGRDRILIKVATTWEGIRAAEELERDCYVRFGVSA